MNANPMTIALSEIKFGHEFPGISLNVRNFERDADFGELLASIKAEGLLQPLAVIEPPGTTTMYVVDGNRRLAALKKIGKPIPRSWLHLIESSDVHGAIAKGLAANVQRVPLHEVDRFEAFAALIPKFTPDEIAARFGIDVKLVDRSLALARLSPKIRNALREGKLNSEAARAFTVEPDQKRQEAVFERLKKRGSYALRRWDIRSELLGDQQEVAELMKFVGADVAKAAGVTVAQDLFAEKGEEARAVTNPGLLEKLAKDKIKEVKDGLLADGWGSVAMAEDLPWNWDSWKRTPKAKGDDRKKLMAVLKLQDGALKQWLGVHKSVEKAAADKRTAKKKAAPNVLSNSLKDRLEVQLMRATQDAIRNEPYKDARAQLYGAIVADSIRAERPTHTAVHVRGKLEAIRLQISAKVMEAALLKRFDAKDFFPKAPKGIVLKSIEEAGFAAEAKKLSAGTKAAAWKFALGHVPKTGWLPKELRVKTYSGPGAK